MVINTTAGTIAAMTPEALHLYRTVILPGVDRTNSLVRSGYIDAAINGSDEPIMEYGLRLTAEAHRLYSLGFMLAVVERIDGIDIRAAAFRMARR